MAKKKVRITAAILKWELNNRPVKSGHSAPEDALLSGPLGVGATISGEITLTEEAHKALERALKAGYTPVCWLDKR